MDVDPPHRAGEHQHMPQALQVTAYGFSGSAAIIAEMSLGIGKLLRRAAAAEALPENPMRDRVKAYVRSPKTTRHQFRMPSIS